MIYPFAKNKMEKNSAEWSNDNISLFTGIFFKFILNKICK